MAVAFVAVGMTAAGWNHRYFVRAMFALAALLALVAIFWRQILSHLSENVSGFIASLGNNPPAWFVIFIVGMSAMLLIARMRRSPKPQRPTDPGFPSPATANPNLTVIANQTNTHNHNYFHIAPNPNAAADQAFAILQPDGTQRNSQNVQATAASTVSFTYDPERPNVVTVKIEEK
jgi:hypothetical protein